MWVVDAMFIGYNQYKLKDKFTFEQKDVFTSDEICRRRS
jgi:hypothetical protein